MAKITTAFYRWDQSHGQYDVMYSSDNSIFYADVEKLFAGASQFFDAVKDKDESLKGLRQGHYKRIGYKKLISGASEKECTDNVSAFHRRYVTSVSHEEKVILYSFEYRTKTSSNEHSFGGFEHREEFSMRFKYNVAVKKMFGDKAMYTLFGSGNYNLDGPNKTRLEIPWTQEMEDFIKSFEDSFDKLVARMRPFFETEGKIMELIGRNILSA